MLSQSELFWSRYPFKRYGSILSLRQAYKGLRTDQVSNDSDTGDTRLEDYSLVGTFALVQGENRFLKDYP
jgi:hypothetical protein